MDYQQLDPSATRGSADAMELAPGLHTLHGARAAEVIAIAVFAEPAALTGELAGLLTIRVGTIPLPISGPADPEEKTDGNDGIYAGLERGSWRAEPAKNPKEKKTEKNTAPQTKSKEG